MLRRRWRRVAMTRRAAVFPGQGDADQLFDIAQESHFLSRAQRDGDAVGAGARGAADAMDIGFGTLEDRNHHMADAVDVDARAAMSVATSCGSRRSGIRQHPLAVVLRLVAVNGVGRDAGPGEPFTTLSAPCLSG